MDEESTMDGEERTKQDAKPRINILVYAP